MGKMIAILPFEPRIPDEPLSDKEQEFLNLDIGKLKRLAELLADLPNPDSNAIDLNRVVKCFVDHNDDYVASALNVDSDLALAFLEIVKHLCKARKTCMAKVILEHKKLSSCEKIALLLMI